MSIIMEYTLIGCAVALGGGASVFSWLSWRKVNAKNNKSAQELAAYKRMVEVLQTYNSLAHTQLYAAANWYTQLSKQLCTSMNAGEVKLELGNCLAFITSIQQIFDAQRQAVTNKVVGCHYTGIQLEQEMLRILTPELKAACERAASTMQRLETTRRNRATDDGFTDNVVAITKSFMKSGALPNPGPSGTRKLEELSGA